MSVEQSDDVEGQIRFHQWCRPPLQSGEYELSVDQSVTELDKTFSSSLSFTVDAPRIGMQPDDVYAVYPPKGQAGAFGTTLPHIVFSRRTLPWEATIDGTVRADDDPTPWLALIVLGPGDCPEGFPKLQNRPVEDAVETRGNIAGPAIKKVGSADTPHLMANELGRTCTTIDIDTALLRRVAPNLADLPLLSHVREVLTDDKETASFVSDGWFSVVVANRLPEAPPPETDGAGPQDVGDSDSEDGIENRAYLVSLVGLKGHLDGTVDAAASRLIVLANWSFRCNRGLNFTQLMRTIDPGRLAALPKAPPQSPRIAQATPKVLVSEALGTGFVPLPHAMRLGDHSVSWYRGPLTPVAIRKENGYAFREAPDHALRYSAVSGMFDASYAAASQLGRLLAMRDRHFAGAMQAFRQSVRSEINAAREARLTAETLGMEKPDRDTRITREFLMTLDGGWADRLKALHPRKDAPYKRSGFERIQLTPPLAVRHWLTRLSLLYRVPFSYIVPDGSLLPRHSLRFFHLDPTWIKCLLEGACSVGRSGGGDSQIDRKLRQQFLDFALREARTVRQRPPEPGETALSDNPLDLKIVLGEDEEDDGSPDLVGWAVSGFLMRSPLVDGWQGLEVRACAADGTRLDPLRIDRMSPEVLLCLFDGDVDHVKIAAPPEGLHFGVTLFNPDDTAPDQRAALTLRSGAPVKYALRSLNDGSSRDLDRPYPLAVRGALEDRRLDFATLASNLSGELAEKKLRDGKTALTSAELALQLLDASSRLLLRREEAGVA